MVLKRVLNVNCFEGMDHSLIHKRYEINCFDREEIDLGFLLIQIKGVATSIIHNMQHLEFHAYILEGFLGLGNKSLVQPIQS